MRKIMRTLLKSLFVISLTTTLILEWRTHNYEYVLANKIVNANNKYVAYYTYEDKEYKQEISKATARHLPGCEVSLFVDPNNPHVIKNQSPTLISSSVAGVTLTILLTTIHSNKINSEKRNYSEKDM